jgi:cytochrome oxidase Cu insertion factor (SCO1/SenC/PrrC family)
MSKTIIWLTISINALVLAIYLFYFPPNQFFNKLTSGLALYGFQTELKLSSYPMENHRGDIQSWENFSDKPLYITTGFTACRLTCPVTMEFYRQMASHSGEKVRYALFTIDPENDTAQKLANYINAINPDFIGLRTSNTVLLKNIIAELQQAIYDTGERDNIHHKSFIYLIHPKLSGLIIYTKPDVNLMINDLKIIEMQED